MLKQFFRQGIAGFNRFRTKLMLSFFCVICLTLLGVGVTYYKRMTSELEKNTYTSLERLVNQTVNQIELQMENVQREAWNFFSDTDFQIFTDNMGVSEFFPKNIYYRNKLHTTLRNNRQLALIALHDLNGNSMFSGLRSNINERERLILENETKETVRLATERQGTGAWRVATSLSDKDELSQSTLSYVQAIKKINTYEQKQVGALRIDLLPEWLTEQLRGIRLKEKGSFSIVDSEGRVLLSEKEIEAGKSLTGSPLFDSYVHTRRNGKQPIHVQYDGKRFLTVYAEFRSVDWILIGSVPLTEVLEGADQARKEAFTIGLISLLVAMTIALILSAGVTRPLGRLRTSMKQVELGNFDVEVPLLSRDEIGSLGGSFNRMTREIRALIKKVYEAELLKKEAEIIALQSQVNPHFLYNALSTVDSIASVYKDSRISSISQGLASMFRYSISGSQTATVAEEVEQVKLYLSIQKVRYGERLEYDIFVERGLEKVNMPKLLLQPIVENAFVHGVERKRGTGCVRLDIRTADNGTIAITVADNGVGISEKEAQRLQERLSEPDSGAALFPKTDNGLSAGGRTSIGLLNVTRRIRLFYGEGCGIHINSNPGEGTTVRIAITDKMEGGYEHDKTAHR